MSGFANMMFSSRIPPAASTAYYLGVASGTSPYQQFYKTTTNSAPYSLLTGQPDTTVSDTSTHYGSGAWNPTGTAFAIFQSNGVYVWTRSGDSFTKVNPTWTQPSTTSPGGLVWSKDGNWVGGATTAAAGAFMYSWNGSTLTKVTIPAPSGISPAWANAFNISSNRFAVGGDYGVVLYAPSGGNWVSQTITWSGTSPAGQRIFGIDYSPDGNWMACVNVSQTLYIYSISGDTYTYVTSFAGGANGRAVAFTPDSKCIVTQGNGILAFGYNGSSWSSITAPTNSAGADRRSVAFNGAGTLLVNKPATGVPKMWTVSGSGTSTTFSEVSSMYDTNPTATGYGTAIFSDSPQNF